MNLTLPNSIQLQSLQQSNGLDYSGERALTMGKTAPAFGDILAQVKGARESDAPSARESAEDLVAMTFVQPLLAQMRSDVFGGGPFSSGTVQDRLSPFADAAIARDIVKGSRLPIVDAIERTFNRAATQEGIDS